MAVNYTNAVKVARMAAVVAQAGATAVLEIGTTGMGTILATFNLSNPIAPAATGAGVLTLSGLPLVVSGSAAGNAASARIRTAVGGTDIITGLTVGMSGADIIVDNTAVAAGQSVTLSSASITHA